MLDKNLVVISEFKNPTNSFTFYSDPESMGYEIDVVHTNIDAIKANEVYTHIRNRNTKLNLSLLVIETEKVTVDDCVAFFEKITAVSEDPYPAVNLFYDGREVISKNFVIVKVAFSFQDYLHYEYDSSAKARRATVTLTLQAFQSNFIDNNIKNNIIFLT